MEAKQLEEKDGTAVLNVDLLKQLDGLLESIQVTFEHVKAHVGIHGNEMADELARQEKLGEVTQSFTVGECYADKHYGHSPNIRVIQEDVVAWDPSRKMIHLSDSQTLHYHKLCIATGASPKTTLLHPNVLQIRDTESIDDLRRRLSQGRRIILVGNGGIATELVYELKNVEVIWVIRHASISATYFDEDGETKEEGRVRQFTIIEECKASEKSTRKETVGCALGPNWLDSLQQASTSKTRHVHVIRDAEVTHVQGSVAPTNQSSSIISLFPENTKWNIWATLSTGEVVGCDLVIEATGVNPNSDMWSRECNMLAISEDGGILVDEHMMTTVADVYAAGDVCTASWAKDKPHWSQIRLWTQARQMGIYCARAMVEPDILLDIAFDLFSHVTTFLATRLFCSATLEHQN
uniref:RNase H type-1 domain-containing protein n=1 Tax=Ditylenchus dipsaci TaxID=166011 RepID=A0A915DJP2_9BILA